MKKKDKKKKMDATIFFCLPLRASTEIASAQHNEKIKRATQLWQHHVGKAEIFITPFYSEQKCNYFIEFHH